MTDVLVSGHCLENVQELLSLWITFLNHSIESMPWLRQFSLLSALILGKAYQHLVSDLCVFHHRLLVVTFLQLLPLFFACCHWQVRLLKKGTESTPPGSHRHNRIPTTQGAKVRPRWVSAGQHRTSKMMVSLVSSVHLRTVPAVEIQRFYKQIRVNVSTTQD